MSGIKYHLGIILAVLLVAAGGLYVYFAHYAPLRPENDTVITAWYVDDDAMWHGFDRLVQDYNSSEGAKYGITVETKAFDSQAEMYDKICEAIDNGKELPDLTVCDTDFAAFMNKKGVLADMASYFRSWETSAFDENMVTASTEGELAAVPIASETNVYMVNTGAFSDTEAISNFEKLCSVADEYYGRTGESFFTISDYSLFFRTAVAQLHDDFDAVSPHESNNKNSKYIYKILAESAYNRGFGASDSSAAKLVADGKLACALVSSADVMKYEEYINPDEIEFITYPCLKDGDAVYVEKVTGITVSKGDSDSERASVMFIRWFSSQEINAGFTAESGYIPATGIEDKSSDSKVFAKLMTAVKELKENGEIYTYSASAEYSENSRNFNSVLQAIMGSLS